MARAPRPRRKTITRWRTADGQECPAGTPGATARREESSTWYGWVGGKLVALGTDDEAEAWTRMRRLLKSGVPTAPVARKGLSDHLEDWLATVADGGASAARVALLRQRVARLISVAGWRTLADLTPDSCSRALATIRKTASARTRNHYLAHVSQFGRWLTDVGRLDREPFRGIRTLNVATDRRVVHRLPTDAEMALLFAYLLGDGAATRKGTTGKGPRQRIDSGRRRALAYRVALATGLRSNEVRTLTRESFDLDGRTVMVQAAHDKRRRADVLPLPTWLADELRAWFADGGATWQDWPRKAGEVLSHDLASAGVALATPAGKFTWHSMRVWFVTQLSHQPGISPKVLLDLSRHSAAQLTLVTYAKSLDGPTREAIEKIPPP